MKTKEELNALKEEVETLNKKLAELNEEELAQVVGGASGCVDSLRGTGGFDVIYPDELNQKAAYKHNYIN